MVGFFWFLDFLATREAEIGMTEVTSHVVAATSKVYLALIQSLSLDDAAGRASPGSTSPSPYQLPPDLTQARRHWYQARFFSSSGSVDFLRPGFSDSKSEAECMYEQIQHISQQLKAGAQGETRVLFVDEFNRE